MTTIKANHKTGKTFKEQQRVAIFLVCAVVLVISLVGNFVYDFFNFHAESRTRLSAVADVLASDVAAPLVFGDGEAVAKAINSLKTDSSIHQLCIFDDRMRIVAFYAKGAENLSTAEIRARATAMKEETVGSPFDSSPEVLRPIMLDRAEVGAVVIEMDGNVLWGQLYASLGIGLALLLLGVVGSYLMARYFEGVIVSPVISLAETMEEVRRTKDYNLRAKVGGVKEIADLAGGLNEMLDEIALRDAALMERQEKLHRMANYDMLTGLPNRVLFKERVSRALLNSERTTDKLAILFIDLDDFKLINDTHGHRVGDLLLMEVSRRLEAGTRTNDTLARLGGDEFIILLQKVGTQENAVTVARKHLVELLKPYMLDDKQLFISASIGIAHYPDHGNTAEILVKSADIAMYHAKEKGKNNVETFTADLYSRASERLSLMGDLRRAIDNREFTLYYQPRIDLKTGHCVGAEALIRWNHPQNGMIGPASFVGLAEETGLIMALGEWVIYQACKQLGKWHAEKIMLPRISVNVSPLQFQRQNLVELVRGATIANKLCTRAIELEITESALMADIDDSIKTLKKLRNLGFCISIDDFGTGYSSLSNLRSLPVDILKIDRSFVTAAAKTEDDYHVLSAIISMGRSLHLGLVAEGVEYEDQARFLAELGCPEAQGYYFAKPMPAENFAKAAQSGELRFAGIEFATGLETGGTCCNIEAALEREGAPPVCIENPGRPPACHGQRHCLKNVTPCEEPAEATA